MKKKVNEAYPNKGQVIKNEEIPAPPNPYSEYILSAYEWHRKLKLKKHKNEDDLSALIAIEETTRTAILQEYRKNLENATK
jgi:uncharacterized iron-regulated protein